jgi:hypothetical protein
MTKYIRQGECNRCGQCCGAEGSPNQDNPWPKSWPISVRNWLLATFKNMWPHAELVGLGEDASGKLQVTEQSGNHTIRGNKINWIWISGHALCKDLAPFGDDASYSLECPWLLDDPGDGTRPCVLVGTKFESMWTLACEHQPPIRKTDKEVAQWQAWHPLCSYTWELE